MIAAVENQAAEDTHITFITTGKTSPSEGLGIESTVMVAEVFLLSMSGGTAIIRKSLSPRHVCETVLQGTSTGPLPSTGW